MASLKALKSVFLQFATNSPCAGLYLLRRLHSPKLAKTNPDCKIKYKVGPHDYRNCQGMHMLDLMCKYSLQIVPPGSTALLQLTFADGQNEELDISHMQAGQVYAHISSRIEERAMSDVLTQNNFVGKKLATSWGL